MASVQRDGCKDGRCHCQVACTGRVNRTEAVRDVAEDSARRLAARPGVVACPFCEAIVTLTDSECWRCNAYFAADTFEEQRYVDW